jgi:hypothetical protein
MTSSNEEKQRIPTAAAAGPPALDAETCVSRPSPTRVTCRQIATDDLVSILELLCEGFPRLPRRHWVAALEVLSSREIPVGMPRYGYMIESGARAVGVLLVIATELRHNGTSIIRSNGSSWYVHPSFRTYGGMLLSPWLRVPADVYLNVFPADHTFSIIEARGFTRFTSGVAVSVPALSLRRNRTKIFDAVRLANGELQIPIPEEDRRLLADHARAGCIAFWCQDRHRGYPFIFRKRFIKTLLPCAQLIYCRDLQDLTRLAGPMGRHLLRRGLPLMLAATNGPIPGILGLYFNNKYPMYFRGDVRPQPSDIAYTEAGLFGF